MSESSPPPGVEQTPSPRHPVNNLLIVAILILLGQIAYQQSKIWRLEGEVAQATKAVEDRAAKIAADRLQGRREDLVHAVDWLQQLYKSDDGLKRPNGLWLAEQGRIDAEAIGAWIFDVYLNQRIAGASDEAARKTITDAIRGTDEWRRLHSGDRPQK